MAASMARDGDTIEVEAGDYVGDVAVWKQDRLTIRGIGKTRPRLIAAGANAEGKGIWVMRGGRITVENLEFRGARVPDHNGAGIRFEGGQLIVRNCKFEDNENGILTSGKPDMTLDIENSEFGNNGAGDGRTHNIYVGHIGRLRVSGIYSHHARGGHLLKSRALENFIFYNRLSDESGGHASYELEFPNGGIAYVVGNLIEQGSQTENSNIVSFGAEGYKAPLNMLYLVNNTIVDDRPTPGNPLAVKSGADKVVAMNNLLVTDKPFSSNIAGEFANNPHADWNDFVLPQRFDYRLKRNSALVGKYVNPPSVPGLSLIPQREYAHPAGTRPVSGPVRVPGALQDTGA
ncbi:MAG TPA: right-handed parallel beta-helix repeat-containing protein [Rhodocyclaceae bacterium]|nr:right-handed parallel beta-helix repeat-containing protein [Rhodocyclaceae bacterium]